MVTLSLYEAKWNETEWREVFFVMFCFFWLNRASVIGYWGVWGWRCHNGRDNGREREDTHPSFFDLSNLRTSTPFFHFARSSPGWRSINFDNVNPSPKHLNLSFGKKKTTTRRIHMSKVRPHIYTIQSSLFLCMCVSFLCLVFSSNRPKVSMKLSKVGVRERQLLVSSFGT